MQLKDIFALYRFGTGKKLSDLRVTIVHRGAPQDKKMINFAKMLSAPLQAFPRSHSETEVKIFRAHFEYFDKEEKDFVYIPFHRILEIKAKGKIMYKKFMRHGQ